MRVNAICPGVIDTAMNDVVLSGLGDLRGHDPTELQRQRVSYILGILKDDSGITRARIEEVLAKQEGKKAP